MSYREYFEEISHHLHSSEEIHIIQVCRAHREFASFIYPMKHMYDGFNHFILMRRIREDHIRQYHPGVSPNECSVTTTII